jgi:hypothetical protein
MLGTTAFSARTEFSVTTGNPTTGQSRRAECFFELQIQTIG